MLGIYCRILTTCFFVFAPIPFAISSRCTTAIAHTESSQKVTKQNSVCRLQQQTVLPQSVLVRLLPSRSQVDNSCTREQDATIVPSCYQTMLSLRHRKVCPVSSVHERVHYLPLLPHHLTRPLTPCPRHPAPSGSQPHIAAYFSCFSEPADIVFGPPSTSSDGQALQRTPPVVHVEVIPCSRPNILTQQSLAGRR